MTRNTAREIAAHLSYELSFTDKTVDELLKERLTPEAFAELAGEDSLYADAPNAKQAAYITRLVKGVDDGIFSRNLHIIVYLWCRYGTFVGRGVLPCRMQSGFGALRSFSYLRRRNAPFRSR